MSNRATFTAQFIGFSVVVKCEECKETIGITNDTPQKTMDKMIKKFRRDHEKAHKEGVKNGKQ